ncbi:MAG: hypothetical protein J6K72_03410 [Clostridia bacterium]|nr:hypothetical protein [Clostridia bacterium]
MELRVLDDVFAPGDAGAVLLCMDDENAPLLKPGMVLEDALGNRHRLESVLLQQEGIYTLYFPEGKPEYFERLFRNVKVDATCMHFQPEEE